MLKRLRPHCPRPILLSALIVLGLFFELHQAKADTTAEIVVAGGCFWCVESDFEQVDGVIEAISGFTGGTVPDASYKQVVRGGTGHFEAVRILYDPEVVTPRTLYHLFFRSIDPLDAGGQFCDRGSAYRTAIFADGADRPAAEAALAAAQAELGQREIVTPILPLGAFYEAEEYHQDYYKSQVITLTRFGPITREKAYKRYREGCGRDARVEQIWGSTAPFIN